METMALCSRVRDVIHSFSVLARQCDGCGDLLAVAGEKIYNQETLHRLFPEFILPAMSG